MFALLALLILAFLARSVLLEWKPGPALQSDPEVGRLRQEVDELSAQVRRLTEEQSFMLGLLAEDDRHAALPPGGDPVRPPNDRPNPESPDGDA
jgi:hypothetical protein